MAAQARGLRPQAAGALEGFRAAEGRGPGCALAS